jgi:hypothetical protein
MTQSEALQIIHQTVSEYFPEIKSDALTIKFVKNKDYYMAVNSIFLHQIFIDKSALKLSMQAFRGCLAHELAHIVLTPKRGFFQNLLSVFNDTKEERETDLFVIERGLGFDLLQFHKEHNKIYKSYKADEGLTKKEIIAILKAR